ncbi:MAG: hypothetical protein GF329_00470 [Candidatus Lokiarchaeota archaeon]|nr:hypothetical protein [Candidatus Lokiarchaeota archaeon]
MEIDYKIIVIIAIIASASILGIFLVVWLTADQSNIVKGKLECIFTAQDENSMGTCLSQTFKNSISADYMFYLINESRTYYGDFVGVSVSNSPDSGGRYSYNATFGWSTVSGKASVNIMSRRIDFFEMGYFIYTQSYIDSINLSSVYVEFEKLPSNGSLLVAVDNTILHTYNADKRKAVGSTFKLFVLQALEEHIDTTATTWSDTWPVQDKYKSLYTNGINRYANGTLLTLKTYADYMINISDNSATDHLINYLDRSYVESFLPSTYDVPLLTTAESFKLRYLVSDTDLDAYLLMNDAEKRNYLDNTIINLDVNSIPSSADWTANIAVEKQIEWIFNISEIYHIQNITKNLDSTWDNWGLAWIGMTWPKVSYKGGSDVGVYAMAHALYNGTNWHYVTFIANNYQEFNLEYGYIGYVPGQIGYEALCMRIMRILN